MKTCRNCRLQVPDYYVGSTGVCFDCEGPATSSSGSERIGRAPIATGEETRDREKLINAEKHLRKLSNKIRQMPARKPRFRKQALLKRSNFTATRTHRSTDAAGLAGIS